VREDDGKLRPGGGYGRTALALNRVFNASLAVLLFIGALPVFVVLTLLIWIVDGRPIFYRGIRLGLHRRPFTMYKFRTLAIDAEQVLGAELLSDQHRLTTKLGKFLRETRLDELPQIFNILRGDMDFVGPRPERPVVYEKVCRFIPGYDRRFEVKPALIGFSQLYTPHGTPKRIRTYIDNRLLAKKQILLWDLFVILTTGFIVLRNTLVRLWTVAVKGLVYERILGRYAEKRVLDRIAQPQAVVRWSREGTPVENGSPGELVDINAEAFLMRSDRKIEEPFPGLFTFQTELVGIPGVVRKKAATCRGTLHLSRERDGAHEYVVKYEPVSPFHFYMVHQYFLRQSIVEHE